MKIERITELSEQLQRLVNDPQPGLLGWCEALHWTLTNLSHEWENSHLWLVETKGVSSSRGWLVRATTENDALVKVSLTADTATAKRVEMFDGVFEICDGTIDLRCSKRS